MSGWGASKAGLGNIACLTHADRWCILCGWVPDEFRGKAEDGSKGEEHTKCCHPCTLGHAIAHELCVTASARTAGGHCYTCSVLPAEPHPALRVPCLTCQDSSELVVCHPRAGHDALLLLLCRGAHYCYRIHTLLAPCLKQEGDVEDNQGVAATGSSLQSGSR
jgi:hypothetical protein